MALPKWAQEQIARDERTIAELTAERDLLRQNQFGPEDTNTLIERGWRDEPPINLPNGGTVTFKTKTGRIRARVDRDGNLDLNGDRGLRIRPVASNAVRVSADGDDR